MNAIQSIQQRIRQQGLRWKLARPPQPDTPRNRAFARYARSLLKEFQNDEQEFLVVGHESMPSGRNGKATLRLELLPPLDTDVQPGDLLWVHWSNLEDRVEQIAHRVPLPSVADVSIWEKGLVYRPARRIRAPARQILRDHLDLATASPALIAFANAHGCTFGNDPIDLDVVLDACPSARNWNVLCRLQNRTEPRLYTVARAPDSRGNPLELLVSISSGPGKVGSGRASSFLSQLQIGNTVRARLLNHPHRLPCVYGHTGPGWIIATGTGIAMALAYLRQGVSLPSCRLIWGIHRRDLSPVPIAELEACVYQGKLGALEIVESAPASGKAGTYVQDWIGPQIERVSQSMQNGGWIYISGHHAMAEAVHRTILDGLTARSDNTNSIDWKSTLRDWSDDMRYIESASG